MADDISKNPDQAQIAAINDRKVLIDAQDSLLKSQTALIKDTYPALGDLGKKGALVIETAERDKFHVTARSAEAFILLANQLVKKIREVDAKKSPVVILQDVDRSAAQSFMSERMALSALEVKVASLLAETANPMPMAFGGGLLELSALLTQFGQFSQLFRTDKNLAFTESQLPDEVLLDLIAWKVGGERAVHYPAGELDRFYANEFSSALLVRLKALLRKRDPIAKLDVKGNDVLAEMSAFATRLASADPTSKVPPIVNVLRGELVQQYLSITDAILLSVKVVSKGGASLKTSGFFRSDHLYAAGGAVVSYRIGTAGKDSKLLTSGVLAAESGFIEVPLKR